MRKERTRENNFLTVVIGILALVFIAPIIIILYNSFKSKLYISNSPFTLPNSESFVGFKNYVNGLAKTGLIKAFGWSLFITVFSVLVIIVFTSMTAWFITRSKSRIVQSLYYLFIFAMIVPFQMVMFSMSKMANMLHLDNPVGIILIYLGYGSGLSIFIFAGFVKAVPIDIEEAAYMDGCTPFQTFFRIVFPLLKSTTITVAVLNAMWVWNDYLLPTLVLPSEVRTIPMAIQYLRGGYGSIDMGDMMAMLVLAIIPIIVFYLSCQKYIIQGVAAGAVKG